MRSHYIGHKMATEIDEPGSAQDLRARRHHGEINPEEMGSDWTCIKERPQRHC